MLGILLFSAVLVLAYILTVRPSYYWKNKNVKTNNIISSFAENFWVILGLDGFSQQITRSYNSFPNERYFGSYQFTKPVLFSRDPELIKRSCVKDFDHFSNRQSLVVNPSNDLLSRNLVALKGQEWKDMRSTLSPAFTSLKMKAMFNSISQNAEMFVNYFLEQNEKIVQVEFKDVMSRFTNDVIANTVYGSQVDSLKDRENEFFEMGRRGTTFLGLRIRVLMILYIMVPKLANLLRLPSIDSQVQSFFIKIVKDTIDMRKAQNLKKSDVIGISMDAQNSSPIEKETENTKDGFAVVEEHLESKAVKQDLSLMEIASQTFIFFFAGFEAVSNSSCFISYELASNPDIQKRLFDEIDENCSDGGSPSYGTIMNMDYLDMVVSETLRKWPFALATDREVTKEYQIGPQNPGEQPLTIEPGTLLMIPIIGLHRDPKYFPNPEKFDPERFSPENRKNINPYAYIPFGIGPRNCIGNRFALMEVKALISKISCHFEIVPIERTQIPLIINKTAFSLIPTDGFHLGLKRRN